MTAPVLTKPKFWIVVPQYAENQIKNPAFAHPDFVEDWTADGTGVTISSSGDKARRGVYSMKVTPASGVSSGAYYNGLLKVENGKYYTFSCDVLGVAGQAMRITINDSGGIVKATKTFTATGYWQREEVTWLSNAAATNYRVYVLRDATASVSVYYVDGAQFEQANKASTYLMAIRRAAIGRARSAIPLRRVRITPDSAAHWWT